MCQNHNLIQSATLLVQALRQAPQIALGRVNVWTGIAPYTCYMD